MKWTLTRRCTVTQETKAGMIERRKMLQAELEKANKKYAEAGRHRTKVLKDLQEVTEALANTIS